MDGKTLLNDLVGLHRAYALSPRNRVASHRIGQLKALRAGLISHREQILRALAEDLAKPEMEVYASEFAPVLSEITYACRHLRRWMRWRRPRQRRRIIPTPFGAALIIGTWNYPIQLTLSPLVAAIAAGNGVTIKPSELSPATSYIMRDLIESVFDREAVAVVLGGPDVSASLVDSGYDKVFFTGSTRVGTLVAEAAAKHHSDLTLELGGKSPAIIGPKCDIDYALNRILWGKFINSGQTCMAPDYLLVPEGIADDVVGAAQKTLEKFFGIDPKQSSDLARIVNKHHYDRISTLLAREGIEVEASRPELYIRPTVVRCGNDSPLMEEEIFGPILPVVTYRDFTELSDIVGSHRNPLAVYVFSQDRYFERRAITELGFGGAMINDVVLHAVDPTIPFGGRGASGRGSYHGRFGFDAFSHHAGIVRTRQGRAASMRFPPYRPVPAFLRKLLFGL